MHATKENAQGCQAVARKDAATRLHLIIDQIYLYVWRMGYTIEEARQYHAAAGNLWRQAGACVALSMIRFMGGGI